MAARVKKKVANKIPARPYMLIVTRLVSRHATRAEASAALKRLPHQPGALGVVVEEGTK